MRLEFQVLVVEDHPEAVGEALAILELHLANKGFQLKIEYAQDLSKVALRAQARRLGAELDLVMIDYNLGREDIDGAAAAKGLRQQLRYTEMVFYSTNAEIDLHAELASRQVDGVFIAQRSALPETLTGLADIVVGKGMDLNGMRGIAMAEVADLDASATSALVRVLGSGHGLFAGCLTEAMARHCADAEANLNGLRKLVETSNALKMVTEVFPSPQRHRALLACAGMLPAAPAEALRTYGRFVDEVVQRRNALAHAVEQWSEDGALSLRSAKRGRRPVAIDEAWMSDFRKCLRRQREALDALSLALEGFLAGVVPEQAAER